MGKAFYAVRIDGFDDHYVEAESIGKARYKAYLEFSEAYPCTFRDFLSRSRVSLHGDTRPYI